MSSKEGTYQDLLQVVFFSYVVEHSPYVVKVPNLIYAEQIAVGLYRNFSFSAPNLLFTLRYLG